MDNTREKIYLAALLHDIGKFYQRADVGSVNNSKFLKEHCKVESVFCPQYNGRYSHKHVLWTAQFIEDFSPVFKNLVDSGLEDISVKDNLMNLAAAHHLSSEQLSDLGKIIKEADCLSSGMDRASADALKDAQDEELASWDAFKKKRMIPIMETIHREMTEWHHIPISKMNLTKEYFPQESFETIPNYETLWYDFKGEFKFIQADTYRAFSETLLNLLLKYTSCIPASTINFPDVSLYDHLKTTAALAVCLYDWKQSGEETKNPFLLIGADFSGIQSYIYQIVSKYAAKNLKGRSFYLRLLSDTVVRYLLKELNLFQANVVYNSGGGFYLLAPNTKETKISLEKAVRDIEKALFDTHGTALFVAIDSIELSKDALMHRNGQHLGLVWGDLFKKRDRKKSAKFASMIQDNYKQFFEPTMAGGDSKRDSITGEEFLPKEMPKEKGDLLLKEVNFQQINIGEKLRSSDFLVVKEGEPLPYWKDKTHISPANLGFTYYFLNDNDIKEKKEKLKASADSVSVVTMNGKEGNCDFLRTLDGVNNIYGLEFYGGNEINDKNVPTFEEMCENDSFSRMGVLRMDVDNLGSIFQSGIAPERATLSRYAALSRSFDFFFSGYLNTIWRETEPKRSFIVYSGGDDVFIVGSWEVTIQLAKKIKEDFSEFACTNPAFSLSGGISFVNAKFPIMKAAEMSDEEEKNAKGHSCKGFDKNAISFMGMPLNWDKEFPQVVSLVENLVRLIDDKEKLPKSFLGKVMTHYQNAEVKHHRITKMKTYWMFTYDLSRMKERVKDAEAKQIIENCIKEVCDKNKGTLNGRAIETDYHPLELWTFAARWAELKYRTEK
ncbi:MAG: type III-A CRISPR-associated protein Cas10/Csm1 [Bacteroidales bacterium]|nr:type III-A CRISPR-associated protein Cas10/Csm1 [Bacteroidales bacterium]